jgi:hypothetical protein
MSAPAKFKPCPICGKPRSEEFAPFCSSRCRDRDLAKWLNDGYAVPGPPATPEDLPDPE